MTRLKLNVNGQVHEFDANPDMPLLWVLRDVVGLTGTKFGCGQGLCGSCTVHLDGEATRSCITPVSTVGSSEVTTIEGLSEDGSHPVQQAWSAENVPQCGYCQAGQIMAAAAYLRENKNPTDEDINASIDNLCRCGTYNRIRRAIHRAAREV